MCEWHRKHAGTQKLLMRKEKITKMTKKVLLLQGIILMNLYKQSAETKVK